MFLPHGDRSATSEATAAAQRSVLAQYASVDDEGRLSCWFAPRDSPGGFLVRRIVVQGPPNSVVRVYAGDPDPLTLADATATGSSDVADYAQPLYVPTYQPLVIIWQKPDGTDLAGVATARIEIEELL